MEAEASNLNYARLLSFLFFYSLSVLEAPSGMVLIWHLNLFRGD